MLRMNVEISTISELFFAILFNIPIYEVRNHINLENSVPNLHPRLQNENRIINMYQFKVSGVNRVVEKVQPNWNIKIY
jgi:hypothetical protein